MISAAQRRSEAAYRKFVEMSARRTRQKPLGKRQLRLLRCLRDRSEPCSVRVAAEAISYQHTPTDVAQSMLGLALRGLVERHGDGWRITAAGKAVRL